MVMETPPSGTVQRCLSSGVGKHHPIRRPLFTKRKTVDANQNRLMNEGEQEDFYERVWDVVAEIPAGRVTTYGDIAEYLGRRGAARMVGWALNAAVGSGLPCHRVVNRNGRLTGKRHFETPTVMEERLRSEGVTFIDDDQVALDEHRWKPLEALERG